MCSRVIFMWKLKLLSYWCSIISSQISCCLDIIFTLLFSCGCILQGCAILVVNPWYEHFNQWKYSVSVQQLNNSGTSLIVFTNASLQKNTLKRSVLLFLASDKSWRLLELLSTINCKLHVTGMLYLHYVLISWLWKVFAVIVAGFETNYKSHWWKSRNGWEDLLLLS